MHTNTDSYFIISNQKKMHVPQQRKLKVAHRKDERQSNPDILKDIYACCMEYEKQNPDSLDMGMVYALGVSACVIELRQLTPSDVIKLFTKKN